MTTPKLKDLDKIAREAERAVLDAASLDALKEARRAYLGRRGLVAQLFDQVPSLPAAQRPEAGRRLNELRDRLERTVTGVKRNCRGRRLGLAWPQKPSMSPCPAGGYRWAGSISLPARWRRSSASSLVWGSRLSTAPRWRPTSSISNG